MLLKLWYDSRLRILGCFIAMLVVAILHVGFFPRLKGMLSGWQGSLPGISLTDLQKLASDYNYYNQTRWFQEIERSAIFGIVLAVGGVLTEARTRSALLTLSLPVTRRQWILAQAAFSIVCLLILNLIGSLALAAGGWILHQPIGILSAFEGAFFLLIASAPYVAITILLSSYTGDRFKAPLFALILMTVTNQLGFFKSIDPWLPVSFMRILMPVPFPWQAVLSIVVITAASLVLAIRKFQSTDY